MAVLGRSVRRARRQSSRRVTGYIVTWDVDSRDTAQCARVRRFIFGTTVTSGGRIYRYPGIVERDGVRYLGQSVLFVPDRELQTLRAFFRLNGVGHVVTEASLGAVLPN